MAPGARVIERGKKFDVVIQSPSGYVINMQTGAVNADVSLLGMTAKLEATDLGDGKPWSRKVEEGSITVGGLPARAAARWGNREALQYGDDTSGFPATFSFNDFSGHVEGL